MAFDLPSCSILIGHGPFLRKASPKNQSGKHSLSCTKQLVESRIC